MPTSTKEPASSAAAGTVPVDPRIQARRAEVERARQRRRRQWRFAILGALALVAAAWFVTRTALLDVDQIAVEGAVHTDPDGVREASGIAAGDPILDVDEGDVRTRLLDVPWVADVDVDVSWRGDVVLRVREREPVAMLADETGQPMLVDRDGRVLAPALLPDAGLLAIDGLVAGAPGDTLPEPADDALALVTAVTPGLRSRIEALVVRPGGQFELRVRPSGVVRFCGATDIEAKVRALQAAFAQVDDRGIATIDVCVPEQFTVTRG